MVQFCLNLRQISLQKHLRWALCAFLVISCSYAQYGNHAISGPYQFRAPASFSPDDDVIVVPVYIKRDFMERTLKDKNGNLKPRVAGMKKTIDLWQQQEEFINSWSLRNTGYTLPNEAQKRAMFERQFFRYLTREGGRPYKQDLKEWWEQTDDSQTEVDAVANEDILESVSLSKPGEDKKGKEVIKVGKRFKVRFKPYLNKSRLVFQNPYMDAEFTVGYNGRSDLKLAKAYSTGTVATVNYQFSNKLLVAFVSQHLTGYYHLRVSTVQESTEKNVDAKNNHTMQIIYSRGF